MSVQNAKKFLSRVQQDDSLRKELNSADSPQAIQDILVREDLEFTPEQFVEAHSFLLANSATPEIAENLRLLEKWWYFLTQ